MRVCAWWRARWQEGARGASPPPKTPPLPPPALRHPPSSAAPTPRRHRSHCCVRASVPRRADSAPLSPRCTAWGARRLAARRCTWPHSTTAARASSRCSVRAERTLTPSTRRATARAAARSLREHLSVAPPLFARSERCAAAAPSIAAQEGKTPMGVANDDATRLALRNCAAAAGSSTADIALFAAAKKGDVFGGARSAGRRGEQKLQIWGAPPHHRRCCVRA
jgi:hypothetical protein